MDELKKGLPADVFEVPLRSLPAAEALGRVAFQGLEWLDHLTRMPKPETFEELQEGARGYRLIGDMAVAANKLLAQLGESAAKQRSDRALAELLEQIAAEREEERRLKVGEVG